MTLCADDVRVFVPIKELTTSFVLVISGSHVVVMATAAEPQEICKKFTFLQLSTLVNENIAIVLDSGIDDIVT